MRFFPLFLCFLSFSLFSLVNSQCLNHQKSLLLQLKQPNSSSSSKLQSWNSNTDCCTWGGITCDQVGHVITLDLTNESISTAFVDNSSTLFQLGYLQGINLAYNNFNSSLIPSAFGRLVSLTHLNLSNSGFAGQIPVEIARLKRLVSLDLSTLFGGINPLKLENPDLRMLVQDLSELKDLHLDGVNISNSGKQWCRALAFALPNLQRLSLSNCGLSGPFDESFSGLNSLAELRLDQNNISAELPEFFGNFSNLTFLHLSSCGLVGKFPEKIFQLPRLQILDLSVNPLLQGSLPEFPTTGTLRNLVLSATNFSGKFPDSIGNLRLLTNLEVTSCGFEGSLPNSMSDLTQLSYLDLSSNHFNGPLPPFGLSENLTQINLAHNGLTGALPPQWEKHVKLVNLNLRNNSLNGSVPVWLFRLPVLQKLDLSHNQFNGSLGHFSNASPSLDTIDISVNKLEGQIPMSIFELSGLKIFTISSNKFNGTLKLDSFQNFRNLSSLDLSSNNLTINTTGTHPASFPQVTTLKLGSCNLRTFPDFLRNQSRLSFLDLSDNQIRGRIPTWIRNIDTGVLIHLNLSRNFLEDPEPPLPPRSFSSLAIADLHSNRLQGPIPILPSSASVLDYSNNQLTSIIPSDIGSYIPVAIFFSVSNNSLNGEIPTSICNASYLQVLDLSNNRLNGTIPNCLGRMESLRVLNLWNNSFHGTIPETFPTQCSLRTLNLNRNRLDGEVSKSLENCTKLEVLDLGNNQISGAFPCWLGKLSSLRVLVLRSNQFHGPIPHSELNTTFQMLQIIDLSSNNFTGRLPSERFMRWKAMMMTSEEEAHSRNKHQTLSFGVLELTQLYYQDVVTVTSKGMQMQLVKILTIFTSVDLSNNKFEGDIPEAIGDLTSLYVLNLSRNGLTGPIPSSLGKLKQLESLDLSANELSGVIPTNLAGLNFLSFLNLSSNKLVGVIPKGTQLQSFNESSFKGNEGLCGLPLLNKCVNSSKLAPPMHSQMASESSIIDFDWQFIVVGLGFGAGAALAVSPLLFWPKGRKWYDNLIDKVVLIILPSSTVVYDVWEDSRDNTEESLEDEISEECTEDYNGEEEVDSEGGGRPQGWHQRGRFCVFCSKLDIRRKRVIHDPNCKCHSSPYNTTSF